MNDLNGKKKAEQIQQQFWDDYGHFFEIAYRDISVLRDTHNGDYLLLYNECLRQLQLWAISDLTIMTPVELKPTF